MIFKAFYRRFLAFIVKAMQLQLTLLNIVGPLASLFEGASVMEFVEDVLFFFVALKQFRLCLSKVRIFTPYVIVRPAMFKETPNRAKKKRF